MNYLMEQIKKADDRHEASSPSQEEQVVHASHRATLTRFAHKHAWILSQVPVLAARIPTDPGAMPAVYFTNNITTSRLRIYFRGVWREELSEDGMWYDAFRVEGGVVVRITQIRENRASAFTGMGVAA